MPKPLFRPFVLACSLYFICISAHAVDTSASHFFHGCQGLIAALHEQHERLSVHRQGKFGPDAYLDIIDPNQHTLRIGVLRASNRDKSYTATDLEKDVQAIVNQFRGQFDHIRLQLSQHENLSENRGEHTEDPDLNIFNKVFMKPPGELLALKDTFLSEEAWENARALAALKATPYFRPLLAGEFNQVRIDHAASLGKPGNYQKLVLILERRKPH